MPVNKLKVHQNTTYKVLAKLVGADGQPIDPGLWTVRSQVRSDVDTPLIAEFDVRPDQGGFLLSLTKKQTEKLSPGVYLFDVLGETSDGESYLLTEGELEVLTTITELT